MAKIVDTVVVDPPTSREVVEQIRTAIDSGTHAISLSLREQGAVEVRFRKIQYSSMSAEVFGTVGKCRINLIVMTHPDFSEEAARGTLICPESP